MLGLVLLSTPLRRRLRNPQQRFGSLMLAVLLFCSFCSGCCKALGMRTDTQFIPPTRFPGGDGLVA